MHLYRPGPGAGREGQPSQVHWANGPLPRYTRSTSTQHKPKHTANTGDHAFTTWVATLRLPFLFFEFEVGLPRFLRFLSPRASVERPSDDRGLLSESPLAGTSVHLRTAVRRRDVISCLVQFYHHQAGCRRQQASNNQVRDRDLLSVQFPIL